MRCSPLARCLALALSGAALPAFAAPDDQPPLGLALTTPNFTYYLRSGINAPHYVSDTKLLQSGRALDRSGTAQVGNPLGYHAGYVARGFRTPYFSGGINDVVFWACADNPGGFDCDNGWATLDQIIMPTDVYATKSESCTRAVLGHELFHHVEFGHVFDGGGSGCGGTFGNTACEGQARALQDKVYFDLDLDPAASCVATFRGQVNGYLDAPDLTIWNASYGAALFWTYLMEQYGEVTTEPERGIDFLVDWWDLAEARVDDPSVYQITEDAIRLDHPTHSVLGAYHDFLIANVAKDLDLSGVSAAFRQRYSYRDEEPVAGQTNLMQFKPVAMPAATLVPAAGSGSSGVIAERFGAEYRRFDVSACAAGRVLRFEATPSVSLPLFPGHQVVAPDGMFALLPLRGGAEGAPTALYKYRAKAWSQPLVQPATPWSHVVVAVAGWHTRWPGTVSLRCEAAPPPATLAGASTAQPLVGPAGAVASLTLALDDPAAPGTPLAPLGPEQISVAVGGARLPAIQKVRDAAARMKVSFALPALPPGSADLALEVGGQTVAVPGGVRLGAQRPEYVIALDTSASMGEGGAAGSRLDAARRALRAMLLGVPADARVGLLSFEGNSGTTTFVRQPLGVFDAAQRAALDAQLGALVPGAATRIRFGDLVVSSIAQFDANGGDGERHLLILTDGGDAGADRAALAAQAQAAGVRVHVVALDHRADQPLLAGVAEDTGGTFGLSDATDPATVALLLPAVQKVRQAAARAPTGAHGATTVPPGATGTITLDVDPLVHGGSHVKVFSGATGGTLAAVRLYRPDGSQVLPGPQALFQNNGEAFAIRVSDGLAGTWVVEVDSGSAGGAPLQVQASVEVEDPSRSLEVALAPAPGAKRLDVGAPMLVQAALRDFTGEPLPPATAASALVKVGTGTLELALNDEGQHGDEQAGDRVWSAWYRPTRDGSPTGYDDTGAGSGTNGTYTVEATLDFGDAAGPRLLHARAQVAIASAGAAPDADGDGLPDTYEARAACLDGEAADAALDADGDGADNGAEFAAGSDPCDVDSDEGGETDGSELAHGRSPLRGDDDGIRRIAHLELLSERAEHEDEAPLPALAHTLRFESHPGYVQTHLRRAAGAEGPFTTIATLDAAQADGRHVVTGLVAGETWCYQLVAEAADGARAAASDTVCGLVRADATAPRGSLVLDDGAPRTASGFVTAALAVDGEPAGGMQMELRLPNGDSTGWIAYAPLTTIDASALAAPATITVAARLRDAAGNVSTVYADDIDRVAPSDFGRITGTTRAFRGGVRVAVGDVTGLFPEGREAGTVSLADGSFSLETLPPGTYTLVFEHPEFAPRTIGSIVVVAGQTTALGEVLLEGFELFGDGFED
jgi:hypothetical protein